MASNLDRHVAALAADPGDARAFEALEEAYFQTADWEKLVAIYERRLEAATLADPTLRAPLLFRLGQILEERCLEIQQAADRYTEAIQNDPSFRPALRQLRLIHAGREQWDMVLQIAEVELSKPMEAHERAAYFAEMGDVWLRHLDDPNEALTCFEQALAASPDQQDALAGLARTLEAQGQHAAASSTWERLAEQMRAPDRSTPLVALGHLFAGPLADAERAITYYRRALDDDPRNAEAVEALVAAATVREDWSLLGELYERRFDLAAGARRRTAIALEAGLVQLEHLENAPAARRWLERALELSGDDVTVHHAIAELERSEGNEAGLMVALDRVIELSGASAAPSLLVESAQLHSERGDDDIALAHLERAQRGVGDDPQVLGALAETLGHLARYDELAAVLERRAALCEHDARARATALLELGRLHEQQLDDPEAARDAYERAFEANPAVPGVAAVLERCYRKSESWDALRDLLSRAAREGPRDQRADFHCSLAELLRERGADPSESASLLEAALALDGNSPRALRGLQQLALESGNEDTLLCAYEREAAVAAEPDRVATLALAMVPLLESRGRLEEALDLSLVRMRSEPGDATAVETVARLQEALGRTDELAETLAGLEETLAGPAQIAVRRRLAAIHAERGDDDAALAYLESALEGDPDHVETLIGLRERYTPHRPEDRARILRRLVEVGPQERRAAWIEELSSVLEEQLGDLDGAIVVLWRLVDMRGPTDASARHLESLLERAGRFEELAQQLLERRRTLQDDDGEATAIDLRRAHLLLDPLGQFEAAATTFRAVRERDPESSEAFDGLERALRGGNDAEGLCALLGERAQAESDPSSRTAILLERAILLEESLGELTAAGEAYAAIADAAAATQAAPEAETRLQRLLERSGEWTALRARLEAALEEAEGEGARELHERLAAVCRGRMGDQEACARHLEAAGRLEPARSSIWRSLAVVYEELGSSEDLLRVTLTELDTGPDRDRGLVLHSAAARLLLASHPPREDDAALHYEHLLELEPGHADATEFLVSRCEAKGGRSSDVVLLLLGRLDSPAARDDPALRVSLRLRIADLQAHELDDPEAAIETLEPALAEAGPSSAVAGPLAELYRVADRAAPLVSLCERSAEAADSPAEQAIWLLRLADALRTRGEDDRAAETYQQVLALHPEDEKAREALCDLYRRSGDASSLALLLESRLARCSGRDEVPMRVELARVFEQTLGRDAEALVHLRRVIELDGEHAGAFDQALALAGRLDQPDVQLELVEARLARPIAQRERAALLERRGDVLAGALDQPDVAVACYREAIAIDPERRAARRALRDLLEGLGRWGAVLDCLYIDARGAESDERAVIYRRAADLATVNIGPDAALPWLERLRVERPDDASVVGRIAEVHRLAGRHESVLRALDDELALTDDPERLRDLHVGRALLLEREMHAPGRAIAALEQARALAASDAEILQRLDGLYDLMGRTEERVEVLEARLAIEDPADAVALHRTVAELCTEGLGDPARAVPHLLRAVALTGSNKAGRGDLELLRDLGQTLRRAGDSAGWARACESELAIIESGPEPDEATARRRAELHRDLAWTHLRALADGDTAMVHLRAVLGILDETRSRASQDDTVSLPLDEVEIVRLEDALLGRLRADQNWVALEARLSARLERGGGDAEQWLELARLRDERLHRPQLALTGYAEALARRPGWLPAIRGMRAVAEVLSDWSSVGHALELELGLGDEWSPLERAALLRRLGDVCWRRLDATERAARAYAGALEADPADLESLRALEQLCEAQEDWERALDLLEREVEILGSDDPDRRVWAWLAAAEIARDRSDEPRRALRAYEQANAIAALRPEDRREQAELYASVGDGARFAETYALWCDDPTTRASATDHLVLVDALVEIGRSDEALARAHRATEVDERCAFAWDAAARLHEQQGHARDAGLALERSAELSAGREGAERLVHAARLVEANDLELATRWLRRAVALDSACALAHALLARAAAAQDELDETERAAGRALDLDAAADSRLDAETRLEAALHGGAAARARDRLGAAALFYEAALAVEPDHALALDALGQILFERGDLARAQSVFETRISLPDTSGPQAERLAMLASALELQNEAELALGRFREALDADPDCTGGHAGIVRVCEKAGRIDEAVSALERWAQSDQRGGNAEGASARWLRAGEVELSRGRNEAAEAQLREATRCWRSNARAQVLRAELLWDAERRDDLLALTREALDDPKMCEKNDAVARLSLLRARSLEQSDAPDEACLAYGEATRLDRRCAEAVLARSRLLRTRGDWREAEQCLADFADRHPEPDHRDLAMVHYKRGRLRAGPLEDVDGAVACYERALEVAPDFVRAREPLATLLSHVSERWSEAVRQHARLLDADPTRTDSLRALVRIAEGRGRTEDRLFGLALLRALGAASPQEADEAPQTLPRRIGEEEGLDDRIGEQARRVAQQAAEAIAQVLDATTSPEQTGEPGAEPLDFATCFAETEANLGAPALAVLDDDELADVLGTICALATQEGNDESASALDGDRAVALHRALGRWTRRKLRRTLESTTADDVRSLDFAAWRLSLRGLAAAIAVDRCQGDLRAALLTLTGVDRDPDTAGPSENQDLTALVAGSPIARELVRRICARWCEQLA